MGFQNRIEGKRSHREAGLPATFSIFVYCINPPVKLSKGYKFIVFQLKSNIIYGVSFVPIN